MLTMSITDFLSSVTMRALVVVVLGAGPTIAATAACNVTTFESVLPASASIEKVEHVESGSTYGEGNLNLGWPINPTNLPDLCAVTIYVTSSPTSAYRFGLYLPSEWNSRFLAVGNGGFAGGINWLEMGGGVRYGFAVVSTDTGHNSTATDLEWALNSPEKRTDWGWRAMHGSVATGKKLVEAYYAKQIDYSYYSGCSTGGRQGMKEMQISPDSFDGVLVGSSAWYTSNLNTWAIKVGTYNLPFDGPNHINYTLFPDMFNEVISQCDDIDGVSDGIVSLANECVPDYTVISCSRDGANQSACLTDPQIETAKKVYADYRSASGELLHPGMSPSCESTWSVVLNQSETSPYGEGYARYFLFDDPEWSWTQYNDSVVEYAVRTDPGDATADKYDLSEFQNRGGKMIMYHGLADGLVPSKGSDLYYERVADAMSDGNMTALHSFFRYFQVPGMGHCAGTSVDAPWDIGAAFQPSQLANDTYSVPGYQNTQHDVIMALMDWVESDRPVDSVVATAWTDSTNSSSGVARQRPLCPYPQMARLVGNGNVNESASWTCGADVSTNPPESSASLGAWNPFSGLKSLAQAF